MGYVMKKYLPTLMVWTGFLMVMVGIYLWLGLAVMLIIGGIFIFILGVAEDVMRNKKPQEKQK